MTKAKFLMTQQNHEPMVCDADTAYVKHQCLSNWSLAKPVCIINRTHHAQSNNGSSIKLKASMRLKLTDIGGSFHFLHLQA